MKKIISIILGLVMCISLTSCVTTASAQIDDMYDDVDVNLIITYGTPIYNAEGLLTYYIYRDLYYYPYIYNNRYHFHRYTRPLPPHRHHHVAPPRSGGHVTPHRPPHHTTRPNIGSRPTRPSGGGMRPSTPRSSTRMGGGNRQFGHRR
jgi:hypothetical protein